MLPFHALYKPGGIVHYLNDSAYALCAIFFAMGTIHARYWKILCVLPLASGATSSGDGLMEFHPVLTFWKELAVVGRIVG